MSGVNVGWGGKFLAALGPFSFWSLRALAQPDVLPPSPAVSPIVLEWEAPAGCPSSEDISGEITALLAGRTGGAPLRARARAIQETPTTWRADVTTDNGTVRGERTLHAETCQAAADATALVIVLAVVSDPRPDPPPAAPARVEPPPSPLRPETDSTPPPEERGVSWMLGAQGLAGVGLVPEPTGGVGGVLGAEIDRLRVEVAAAAWLPRDARSTAVPGAIARFQSYSADLRVCYGPRFSAWTLAGCAGARLVYLEGRGAGGADAQTADELQVGPLGGALVTWHVSRRWALRAQVDLAVRTLPRREFRLYGETVYRAPPVGANAALGLELHF